jgi:hypothetical protein
VSGKGYVRDTKRAVGAEQSGKHAGIKSCTNEWVASSGETKNPAFPSAITA